MLCLVDTVCDCVELKEDEGNVDDEDSEPEEINLEILAVRFGSIGGAQGMSLGTSHPGRAVRRGL